MPPAAAAAKPWVLIQKGAPPWPFDTREKAQRVFNQRRFNSAKPIADAALFGPGGESWYCTGTRFGQWERDDDRRKREAAAERETAK